MQTEALGVEWMNDNNMNTARRDGKEIQNI